MSLITACLYQDDIARGSEDLDSVRSGNKRLENMAESKLLDYKIDKSGMILFGNKKFKKQIEAEME